MDLEIKKITETSALELMTGWMYDWWGKEEGYSYEAVRSYMLHSLQKDRLPQTYGLYLDGAIIGMFQFTNEDLFPRPDIYPWLANVYIDRAYRRAGYGGYLLSEIYRIASTELNAEEIFLFTTYDGFYEKFGWEFVEEIDTFLRPRLQRLYRLQLTQKSDG